MIVRVLSRTCNLKLAVGPHETWYDTMVRGYSDNRGEPYEVACYMRYGPGAYAVHFKKARADVSGMESACLVKVDLD